MHMLWGIQPARLVLLLAASVAMLSACREPVSSDRGITVSKDTGGTPAFHLKIGPEGGMIRVTTAEALPAEFQALRERNANDPVWQKHLERFREVVARGAASLAIVDEPLPEGAIARAILDPGASPSRLVVVSKVGLHDGVLMQGWHLLFSNELQMPDSAGRVELTLWPDGRLRATRDGASTERQLKIEMHSLSGALQTARLLKRIQTTPLTFVPGVGMSRMIEAKSP